MIHRTIARRLVMRISQMNGFPKADEAISELINAVERNAPSEKIAEDVISEILDTADRDTRCPMPGEVKRAILSRLEDFRPDQDCKRCNGVGSFEVFSAAGLSRGWDKCKCWARRPAPVYKRQAGDEPIEDIKDLIEKGAAKKRAG